MKKIISLLKRAGKAYFKAYVAANTFKTSNGKVIYVSPMIGTVVI